MYLLNEIILGLQGYKTILISASKQLIMLFFPFTLTLRSTLENLKVFKCCLLYEVYKYWRSSLMNEIGINPHLIRCCREGSQPSGLDYTHANPAEVQHQLRRLPSRVCFISLHPPAPLPLLCHLWRGSLQTEAVLLSGELHYDCVKIFLLFTEYSWKFPEY